jgi:uncharacterized protein YraI
LPDLQGVETVKNILLKAAGIVLLCLTPAVAQAAEGFATANVNMRAGPSTAYPAVTVIPAGASVEIHGCLADVPWCDVEFYDGRGWVAGRYVQALYQQRRVYVEPEYYRPLGIPTVVFSVGNYWDRYYRNRDFYRDRDRWRRGPDFYRPPPRRDFDRPVFNRPGFDRGDRWNDADRRPDRRRPDFDRNADRRPQPDFRRDNRRNDTERPRRNIMRDENGNRFIHRKGNCRPSDPGCNSN